MKWKFWQPEIVYIDRPLGEYELAAKLAELMGDIDSIEITKDGASEVYQEMGRVEGALDVYKDAMTNDIRRYFSAQNDRERDIIRGAYYRTAYFRGLMLDKRKE